MFTQLDTENGDYDLTSEQTVLTHTPSATQNRKCQGMIELGDGTKNLDGTGGDFTIEVTVGGVSIDAGGVTKTLGTGARAVIYTNEFVVPANKAVVLKVTSPNGADTDVDVVARLFDTGDVNVGAIYNDVTSAQLLSISSGLMMLGTVDTSTFTPATTGTAPDEVTTFESNDVLITQADRLNGRRVFWRTGNLLREVGEIKDYEYSGNSKGKITLSGQTVVPANGDTFLIV